MPPDDLHKFDRGHHLEAAELNVHVALLQRNWASPNMAFDVDGFYQRPMLSGKGELRAFELKGALAPFGFAEAYPRSGNAQDGYVTNVDDGRVFTVFDPLGEYRGRGRDDFATGSRGWARLIDGKWVIVKMTMHALLITGQLTGGLVADELPFSMSSPSVASPIGGLITTEDSEQNIDVTNRRFDGDEFDTVWAAWHERDEVYYAIDVMCPVKCDDRTPCEE